MTLDQIKAEAAGLVEGDEGFVYPELVSPAFVDLSVSNALQHMAASKAKYRGDLHKNLQEAIAEAKAKVFI